MGYLNNDDDKLKALLAQQNGGVAPEELNPAEREPDSDVDDPSAPQQLPTAPAYQPSELSSLLPPAAQQQPREELEAPPMKEAPGLPQTIVGGLLDVLINKGRGLPGIVAGLGQDDTPYENWKRKKEQFLANSGGYGRRGISDPQSLWLRQQAMLQRQRQFEAAQKGHQVDRGLRARDLANKEKGTGLRVEKQDRDLNPDNPQSQSENESLAALGVDRATIDRLDSKGKQMLMSLLTKQATTRAGAPLAEAAITQGAREAGANSAATLPDRIAVVKAGAEAQAPYKDDANRRADEAAAAARAESFNKDAGDWVQSLNLINQFEQQNPAGQPIKGTGPMEGRTPDMLADPEQLASREKLRLLREIYARKRSGAAISMSEQDNFKVQTGTNENATDEQIRAAMTTLKGWLQDNVRALSVGREDAAQKVMGAQGVTIPPRAGQPSAPTAKRAPKQRPARDFTDADLEGL